MIVGIYRNEKMREENWRTPSLEGVSLESNLKMDENPQYEIKRILKENLGHLRINDRFVKDVDYFVNSYIHRDEEHTNFFGGNLTGVNKITFSSDDRNELCIDILDVDETEIRRQVKKLSHIGSDWVRGTDGTNLSLLYALHLVHNSSLKDTVKEKTAVNLLIILQCKFLSSLLYGYFKYPVSEKLATAVYETLSKKFYIKKYGTWYRVLKVRAESIYKDEHQHRTVIESFESDARIQYMITDIQTRIKNMILNIYEVTMDLHQKGVGIGVTNALIDNGEKIEVKDIERHFDEYLNYILRTSQEPRSLIKIELVEIVSASITTMPEKLLYDVLNVISDMSRVHDKNLEEMIRELVIYTFDYFRNNKRSIKDLNNIGQLVVTFKSLITASKTNSTSVLKLRDYFDKLVKKNIKSKNPQTVAGVRTGIMLYFILRTITMNHYG